VTVVIGVVTVAVVSVGVVTLTVVIGVLTVTVTGEVGIGSVGTETVGSGSVEGNGDGAALAVDERTAAGAAAPSERCVDTGAVAALDPTAAAE
jgi:hypothetical protein